MSRMKILQKIEKSAICFGDGKSYTLFIQKKFRSN